jgi:long-chain fatty acid transport protein
MQYRLSELFRIRAGYIYNTSPISDADTFYNVGSPLNYQHSLGVGFSFDLCECVAFHLGYTHYFEYDSTGPIILPTGEIPGSMVTNRVTGYLASLGVSVQY